MTDYRSTAILLAPFIPDSSTLLSVCDALTAPVQREVSHEFLVGTAILDGSIMDDARSGRLISAIKTLRSLTGCGLREAKEAVQTAHSSTF